MVMELFLHTAGPESLIPSNTYNPLNPEPEIIAPGHHLRPKTHQKKEKGEWWRKGNHLEGFFVCLLEGEGVTAGSGVT